jgi:hypothetical protein
MILSRLLSTQRSAKANQQAGSAARKPAHLRATNTLLCQCAAHCLTNFLQIQADRRAPLTTTACKEPLHAALSTCHTCRTAAKQATCLADLARQIALQEQQDAVQAAADRQLVETILRCASQQGTLRHPPRLHVGKTAHAITATHGA